MSDLTGRVRTMAAAWVGDPGEDPRTVAEMLRQEDLAGYLIYLSGQPGADLPERFRAELSAARRRSELNRRIGGELAAAHPDAWIVKGADIADLYGPLLRFSWDVDVVCPSVDRLWELGAWLVDGQGLQPSALTLFRRAGSATQDYLVAFTGPDTDGWEWPVQVDISSLFFVGDGRVPAPVRPRDVAGLGSWGRHLVSVCLERFERAFTFKDAVDTGLLVEHMADDELAAVADHVRRFDWGPEFAQLLAAAERIGFDVRGRLPASTLDRLRIRAAPARRTAATLARHAATLGRSLPQAVQHRALFGGSGVSRRVWRRLSSAPALAAPPAPAWFYGMPVTAGPERDPASPRLLETRVGMWYLTATDEVDADALTGLGVSPRT